jgi:2-isopropylmalate synthase
LRDGNQAVGVSFTVNHKLKIARYLDEIGVSLIEGGWPNLTNAAEFEFFERAANEKFWGSIVAFGMTRRPRAKVEDDENLAALLRAGTNIVTLFGKSWVFQIEKVLGTTMKENLRMISESISFVKSHGRRVIFDAEHFFDGFKENAEYAFSTLEAAVDSGAEMLVLCDTRGASYPKEVAEITVQVVKRIKQPIGIHAHNDRGLATANTLAAVSAGATQVQVTVNGIGERCGNADLIEVVGNLELQCIDTGIDIEKLTRLSHLVSELANLREDRRKPFVGAYAFAHKGGIHADAVTKASRAYEHVDPVLFGNKRRVTVSAQAGRASIVQVAKGLGFELSKTDPKVTEILLAVKRLEAEGYGLESANGTLSLIFARELEKDWSGFELKSWKAKVSGGSGVSSAECLIELNIDGTTMWESASGNGPVNAFDLALREALRSKRPEIERMRLTGYRVKELDAEKGTAAKVAVYIDFANGKNDWTTVGVSTNILEASVKAIVDGYLYFLWSEKRMKSRIQNS